MTMRHAPLSDFDRDRVEVTLRRVGAVAEDLRREYPEVEDAGRIGTGETRPAARATELAYPRS